MSISQLRSKVIIEGVVLGGFVSGPDECWKDVVLLFKDRCAVDTADETPGEDKSVSLEILFQLAILPLLFDRASDCVSVPSEVVVICPLLLSSFRSGLELQRLGCVCI